MAHLSVDISSITRNALHSDRVIVYGGAFDPITAAHAAIMQTVERIASDCKTYILFVTDNDEKTYAETIEHRLALVNTELATNHAKNWEVKVQSERMAQTLKSLTEYGDKFTLVLGEDEFTALNNGAWENSEWILENCEFIVFCRNESDCSSSKIRTSMKYNPCYAHGLTYIDHTAYLTENVAWAIASNNYYRQTTSIQLTDNTNAFLDNYRKRYPAKLTQILLMYKEGIITETEAVNNIMTADYAHPSVTATIILHNTKYDTYAIIRRGDYPYKNYWAFPGGFSEPSDESIFHTAVRELNEECNINIDVDRCRLVNIYKAEDPRGWIYDAFIAIDVNELDSAYMWAGDDAVDIAWLRADQMPTLAFHHNKGFDDYLKQGE